jgi:hypothetical protein
MHPMFCAACRHSITELYASVDECFQAGFGARGRRRLQFLNRNVRKLFGMVGNMKGKWCNSCGKYH